RIRADARARASARAAAHAPPGVGSQAVDPARLPRLHRGAPERRAARLDRVHATGERLTATPAFARRPRWGCYPAVRLRQRAIEDLWRRPPGRFDPLDGMRGFASVIVHVYHCGLWTGLFAANAPAPPGMGGVRALVNGFWTGIDIFYVLSG